MNRNVYASLALGSATIKLVVGEVVDGKIDIFLNNTVRTSAKGFKKGSIINGVEISQKIKTAILEAEEQLQIPLDHINLVIPSKDLEILDCEQKLYLEKQEWEITTEEVNKAAQEAIAKIDKFKYKVLHALHDKYFVNGKEVKNPIGLKGHILQINLLCYIIPRSLYDDYKMIIEQIGVQIQSITLSPFAIANQLVLKKDDHLLLMDIGHHTTTLTAFNGTQLLKNDVVNFGGKTLMNYIKNEFSLQNYEQAASLLFKYGQLGRFQNKTIIYSDEFGNEVTMSQLNKLITSVVAKYLNEIKEEFIDFYFANDYRIVLVGGLSRLKNMDKMCQRVFAKPTTKYESIAIGAEGPDLVSSLGTINLINHQNTKKWKQKIKTVSLDVSNWDAKSPVKKLTKLFNFNQKNKKGVKNERQ